MPFQSSRSPLILLLTYIWACRLAFPWFSYENISVALPLIHILLLPTIQLHKPQYFSVRIRILLFWLLLYCSCSWWLSLMLQPPPRPLPSPDYSSHSISSWLHSLDGVLTPWRSVRQLHHCANARVFSKLKCPVTRSCSGRFIALAIIRGTSSKVLLPTTDEYIFRFYIVK